MKLKKISSMLMVLTLALSLTACGTDSKDDKDPTGVGSEVTKAANQSKAVTLVYAEVNPEDSLMGKTATYFKEQVAELSGGTVTIDIQFSGVLGAENDVLDTMLGGGKTVDMARISAFSLTSYGTKITSLLAVPYMFNDREHFWTVAKSDLGQKILDEPNTLDLGVRGLFFVEEGFRHFFFKDSVTDISDVKGKKLRVSSDPAMVGMVEGLGGSATTVSFNELYSSLSSGVVDGAEQPIANYQSNAFNEVAPYMILDGHTLGCGEVIVTDSAWDKLDDAQKEAVKKAGDLASTFNGDLSEKNEEECKVDLVAKGVTFVAVPDLQVWRDACKDIIKTLTTGYEAEVKTIQDFAK
jgi:TRAP-type C4-dicarboxylate transport system substrate-binding protein